MVENSRSSKGFEQIPAWNMVNPNDTRINMPADQSDSKLKAGRRMTWDRSQTVLNEKTGFSQAQAAGRRQVSNAGKTANGTDPNRALTTMGRVYTKILNFSIITRYFLYILPIAIIIAIPIVIGATVAPGAALGGVRIVWIFSWVLIVWFSLWVSKLVAKCLPFVFQFLCGIVSSGTRKYALVIESLEINLSLCGWALTSLATFVPVMTRNPTQLSYARFFAQFKDSTDPAQKSQALLFQDATGVKSWQSTIQKILAAFLISSLILLAEKILIQIISVSYHQTQYESKIKESKHKIWLLSLLFDASRNLFPMHCPEFLEEDYIIEDAINLSGSATPGAQRSGSVTPMRLLQNVGRFGDKLTSAFGSIAQEVTGKQIFNPDAAHSIVVEALEKNASAEALAKRLWMSFVVEGKEALYEEDLVEVLGSGHKTEAQEAFGALDRDCNDDVSLDEMILTICEFGKERHSIANSLRDVDQAIKVLDKLLCTIVFIVSIFVFVAFLNTSFTTTLATAGTALLSLSFIFATTLQEVLGSCIFLFVKHPFDVLDRVDVGHDRLIVKSISLLYTIFRHVDSNKLTQVPNAVLNTLWIENISRSDAMREQLSIFISFDTTLEDIQLLRNELICFVNDTENCRDFQPDISVEVAGIAAMEKLELKVEIRHKSNWSNETVRAARRSKFMCALVLALRKIPINAPGGGGAALGSLDQPSYTVAVSDKQAAENRAAFDQTKDGKRLFPKNKQDAAPKIGEIGSSTGFDISGGPGSAAPPPLRYRLPQSESFALTTLNARSPAQDTANPARTRVDPQNSRLPSGVLDTNDLERVVSIEEVRDMLRRESSKGKRRPSIGAALKLESQRDQPALPRQTAKDKQAYSWMSANTSNTSGTEVVEPSRWPQPMSQVPQMPTEKPPTSPAYPPPSAVTKPRQPANISVAPYLPPQSAGPTPPPKSAAATAAPLMPFVSPISPPLPIHPQDSESARARQESPNTTPTLPTHPHFNPALDASTRRAPSPVQNPFQIHALRAQQQNGQLPRAVRADSRAADYQPAASTGTGIPSQVAPPAAMGAVRRPVQMSGNAFAQQQQYPPRDQSSSAPHRARNDSPHQDMSGRI